MTDSPAAALGKIGQVSLFVRDVDRATRFYGGTLGLTHLYTYGDLDFFDAAGTRLYLHRKDEADWRPGSVLYFEVGDIGATQQKLEGAGVHFRGEPHLTHRHDDGSEEWMTFFDDGEGNMLALTSRVGAAA